MNKWYVYKHIRLDTNEIFYIGIGSIMNYKRAFSKQYRNDHWHNIVNRYNYKVEILYDNLLVEEANNLEIELISLYGRKDLNKGSLVNLTNGGKGLCGYKHTDEHKMKNRNAKLGHTPWNKGKTNVYSNETKLRMVNGRKDFNNGWTGKEFTEEHRYNISQSKKGYPAPNIIKVEVDGVIYNSIKEACDKLGMTKSKMRTRLYGIKYTNYRIIGKPSI